MSILVQYNHVRVKDSPDFCAISHNADFAWLYCLWKRATLFCGHSLQGMAQWRQSATVCISQILLWFVLLMWFTDSITANSNTLQWVELIGIPTFEATSTVSAHITSMQNPLWRNKKKKKTDGKPVVKELYAGNPMPCTYQENQI